MVGYRGVSPGEGAGLVEGQASTLPRVSSGAPPLTRTPARPARAIPASTAAGVADRQGAGAGRDQDQHRPVEAVTERLGKPDHPDRQHHDHGQDDRGHMNRWNRSMNRWVGDWAVSASVTSFTTRATWCRRPLRSPPCRTRRGRSLSWRRTRATGDRVGIGQGLGDVGQLQPSPPGSTRSPRTGRSPCCRR